MNELSAREAEIVARFKAAEYPREVFEAAEVAAADRRARTHTEETNQ